jgi:hypothetical protein
MGFKDKDFKARVVPESLVLFRKGALIVGEAVVQKTIRELRPPEHDQTKPGMIFYHDIVFNPETVKVYEPYRPVEMLERWSGQRLDPRYYTILGTRRDYEKTFPR